MKYITTRCRSALAMQMILVYFQATYSLHLIQRNTLQPNAYNYNDQDSSLEETYYIPQSTKDKLFLRKVKSGNQSRLLNIDLSGLRQDTDVHAISTTSRHKSPIRLLPIDISVLSRNPDTTLPMAIANPKNIVNGKLIMSYDYDSKYDRLPIIKTKPIRTHSSTWNIYAKPAPIHPIIHIPLKVMTTYHSILTNKKQDIGFDFGSSEGSDNIESEQKYMADFILQLLYQLSSGYRNIDAY